MTRLIHADVAVLPAGERQDRVTIAKSASTSNEIPRGRSRGAWFCRDSFKSIASPPRNVRTYIHIHINK